MPPSRNQGKHRRLQPSGQDDGASPMIRTPSRSIFRRPIDQSVLTENKRLIEEIDRRQILRGSLSLGALALLTGGDVTDREAVQAVLKRATDWNDLAQEFLFRPNHLAPTFPESMVVKPPRFNAHYDVEDVKPVDAANWKL